MLPPAKDTSVCSLCNGTGWKSFQEGDVERVTRCDCWRDDINKRLLTDARIPRRYHHCTLNDFVTYDNDTLEDALARSRKLADQFPVVDRGLFFVGDPGVVEPNTTFDLTEWVVVRPTSARADFTPGQ